MGFETNPPIQVCRCLFIDGCCCPDAVLVLLVVGVAGVLMVVVAGVLVVVVTGVLVESRDDIAAVVCGAGLVV